MPCIRKEYGYDTAENLYEKDGEAPAPELTVKLWPKGWILEPTARIL